MNEKRKSKRTELLSKIILKRLDGKRVEEATIDVTDVSKSGVGFTSRKTLTIWTREVIHAFVEIVRIEKIKDNVYSYGGIFIGMPEMDAMRIETYQTVEENVDR